jgi:hypothetical protein
MYQVDSVSPHLKTLEKKTTLRHLPQTHNEAVTTAFASPRAAQQWPGLGIQPVHDVAKPLLAGKPDGGCDRKCLLPQFLSINHTFRVQPINEGKDGRAGADRRGVGNQTFNTSTVFLGKNQNSEKAINIKSCVMNTPARSVNSAY